jgi:cation:H+ antiporter
MIWHPVILLVSFGPLLGGAHLVVRGSSGVAQRLRVAPIVVGLTLVAFGTSAPELVVNVSAAVGGQPTVALGNILGSNIFNIAGTLGLLAVIRALPISRSTTWAEIPLAILAAIVMTVVAGDTITRSEGILLLSFFGLFLAYISLMIQHGHDPGDIAHQPPKDFGSDKSADRDRPGDSVLSSGGSLTAAAVTILGGLVLLILGGEGVVRGAVGTARLLEVPEYIIAASVVAVGTSLPELTTSLYALGKGELDLAVGNAVGSNIFNVFLVLGLTATITPITTIPRPVDHGVHILSTVLLFVFVFLGRGRRISRGEGVILLLLYAGYTGSLLLIR